MTESFAPPVANTIAASVLQGGGSGDLVRAFLVAEEHQQAGRGEQAESIYRGLLVAVPNQPAVLHNLASLVLARGEWSEAEQLLRKAIAAAPEEATFHNTLGALQYQRGELSDAGSSYQHALKLSPDYTDARYNLSLVLQAQGDVQEAEAQLRRAVHKNPQDAKALTKLGAVLLQREEWLQALDNFDRALALMPNLFDAHYYRNGVLSQLQRHGQALAAIEMALQLKPGHFEARQARANTLRELGRHDEALREYGQLVDLQPDNLSTHTEFNRLAWAAGRQALFLQSFATARNRLGDVPALLILEGAFNLRAQRYIRAEMALRRALQLEPENGEAAGLLARALSARGKLDESLPLYKQAIAAEPTRAVHRQELGFMLLKAGAAEQARQLLQSSLQLDADDQLMIAGLTLAQRNLGDARRSEWVDYAKHVRVYDLATPAGYANTEDYNRALGLELDKLHLTKAEPIDQTLRGGTQTSGLLLDQPSPLIAQLRSGFEMAVADYIRSLPDDATHPLYRRKAEAFSFNGSWSCRLHASGYHRNHVHPKGWISSVYYVRLPSSGPGESPQAGWLKFGESPYSIGTSDRAEHLIRPAVGRLVLFPSYFWHGTVPFTDGGDRLTVAFDVVPKQLPTCSA